MIETPFNYTGSKYKLLPQILDKMDYNKSTFVDLFTGGGSVYTNIIDKYDKIFINDIIKELVDIHYNLLHDDTFIQKVILNCVDKNDQNGFLNLRKDFNDNKTADKLFALMLMCTNNMIRFNKKFEFNQTFGKRTFNYNTQNKIDKFIQHLKPFKNKINYLSKNFIDIPILTDTMYYIDPPYGYIIQDGYMVNKQISEAGYNCFYTKQDDINLYNYIHKINNINSSFMISGLLDHNGKNHGF